MKTIKIHQLSRELTTHVDFNTLLLLPAILPIINISKYHLFIDIHIGFLFVGISFKLYFNIVHIIN